MNSSASIFNPNNSLLKLPTLKELQSLAPLSPDFYLGDTLKIAKCLLGKGLYLKKQNGIFLCQIAEVEAYLGHQDPASHSFKGPTPRNQSMFRCGGTCYVYLSYGINFCMNVVTREEGIAEAILIRAAIPLLGIPQLQRNRGSEGGKIEKPLKNLMNGPGKLTQSLGIDLKFNGMRFDQPYFKIVDLGVSIPKQHIGHSPRIGISKAKEERYRFFIKSCGFLSR